MQKLKKICIISLLSIFLITLPITSVARETNTNISVIDKETIELTDRDLALFSKSIKEIFKDKTDLCISINQIIDDCITKEKIGYSQLNFEKLVNNLDPILEAEFSQTLNKDNSVNMPSNTYNDGFSGSVDLSGEQQTLESGTLEMEDNVEWVSKVIWNYIIRPFLNLNEGENIWPTWREDNDLFDGDGPKTDGELDISLYDDPAKGKKYPYQGLDDRRDWNHSSAFIVAFGFSGIATVLCVLTLVLIVGLIGLIGVVLGYGTAYCNFVETFDIEDMPYGNQWPYTPPDGM